MKGKIRKVLGVGLALALVAGFSLVAAVPAAALTQPTVSIDDYTISTADADYTIIFTLGEELYGASDTITITFPDDTTVAGGAISNASIQASPGWFSAAAIVAVTNITTAWDDAEVGGITFSGNATAQTVTASLGAQNAIGQAATVRIELTEGITNPSAVGDYTLTVKTSDETTAVESATYTTTAPVLGGTVEVFNPSDVLMATYSGATAVTSAVGNYGSGFPNYTIEVGPGTYTLNTGDYGVSISGEGLTFKSTDGAADTILDASTCDSAGIWIADGAVDVTVEGFTIDGSGQDGIAICYNTEGVTIQNNIISDATTSGVSFANNSMVDLVVEATVSGNVFEDNDTGINFGGGEKDCTISDNTITGCSATGRGISFNDGTQGDPTQGTTITGNTITDNECMGIYVKHEFGAGYFEDNLIEGNTISENDLGGIVIADSLDYLTELVITGNDIIDNDGVGIVVGSWTATSDAIKFNNITGNDTTNGYGIENGLTGIDVDAALNWWGTSVASEVAAMVNDTGTGATDCTPFLSDTVDAVFSATAVDTNVASLDAEDEVGVVVSCLKVSADEPVDVISAAEYIANPGAPIDNALAFYDVYVAEGTTGADEVVVKFYADGIDEDSVVYAWNELYDTWQECDPQDFSFWGGYAYVTIHAESDTDDPTTPTIEALSQLPFAVCGVPAEFDPMVYDVDEDGEISKTEALNAIADYFDLEITKAEALEVIALYFG